MVDYSRFDHIDTDDEEEGTSINIPQAHTSSTGSSSSSKPSADGDPSTVATPMHKMAKKGKDGRLKFEHDGRTIYEWDQGLEEVNIYIEPPPGITRQQLAIKIDPSHLIIGLRGASPFIDEDLGGLVIPDESTWTFIDGEIQIILQKMRKAEAWECALQGQAGSKIDPYTKEEVRKKLLLERFQEEVSSRIKLSFLRYS
jgi:hypothetical protein